MPVTIAAPSVNLTHLSGFIASGFKQCRAKICCAPDDGVVCAEDKKCNSASYWAAINNAAVPDPASVAGKCGTADALIPFCGFADTPKCVSFMKDLITGGVTDKNAAIKCANLDAVDKCVTACTSPSGSDNVDQC